MGQWRASADPVLTVVFNSFRSCRNLYDSYERKLRCCCKRCEFVAGEAEMLKIVQYETEVSSAINLKIIERKTN